MHNMRAEVGYRVVGAISIRKDELRCPMALVMIDCTLLGESLRMDV